MGSKGNSNKSGLNPDAPLFIPSAFKDVEDFSQEWWNLIQSSACFREYWLRERHEDSDGTISQVSDPLSNLPESLDEFLEVEMQLQKSFAPGFDDPVRHHQLESTTQDVQVNPETREKEDESRETASAAQSGCRPEDSSQQGSTKLKESDPNRDLTASVS
eukprot:TRINITY_DN2063_c0_g1_i1.p1 TRINITY_DN2063_c0_g1~~TRINITY_DN2063_c0_g1_i1.p1  ORF type:complete len:160 (+),score=14.67 TRINITY_DN2063_c0_g1_i1:184-663(+)